MLRKVASGVARVGRTASMVFGLALVLALIFGVVSVGLAANGNPFLLGKAKNTATKVSALVGKVASGPALKVTNPSGGPALELRANEGVTPMTVNATAGKATNLDADKLDGKDSTQIGVNGLQRVVENSAFNSDSLKNAIATCPSGKVLVGTGYDVFGAKTGSHPNTLTDVMADEVFPSSTSVLVTAYEEEATPASWAVTAYAICAQAP